MKKILFLCLATYTNLIVYGQFDRSVRPTGGTAPIINISESEVFNLPNGITVILSENHKMPRVSFNLVLGSNQIIEGPKAGLSNLAGDLLMSGTEKRTKDQLDQEIDFIGATLRSSSSNVFLQCLTKHAEKGLDLMSDVILRPSFPEEEFDRLKKMKVSSILSSKSNPSSMAGNAEARANFPSGHPFGEIETDATIRSITLTDVKNYYRALFTPKGSYLVIVGDVTKAQAKIWAEQYFGAWSGQDKITSTYNDAYFHNGNRVLFIAKPGAPQSVITVSFPMNIKSGDKNQLLLNTLNGIFGGGGFGARLTQNLREKRAYTYGCYSRANVSEEGSYYSISGNFRTEVTDSAVEQILFELDRIQKSEVTEEELASIKSLMAGNFARSLERPITVAQFALSTIKYNLPKDYYQTYLKRLDAITREELLTIAKTYLTATNANIIVVGNENILDKLKRFDSDGAIEKLDALGQVVVERKKATISKDELIEKYLTKATGTENLKKALKKIAKVKSVTRTIEVSAPQIPMPLTMKMYFEAPNKEAFTLEIQNNVVQKSVFNGKSGYELNMQTGKSDYKAEEVEAKKKTVGLFEEANLKANNLKYELIGIETVDGVDAYLLSYSDGLKTTMSYYDIVNFKKIKSTETEGEREETFTYGNFETIEGIDFPKTMAISMDGLTLDGKVLSIEVNKAIDAKIFE